MPVFDCNGKPIPLPFVMDTPELDPPPVPEDPNPPAPETAPYDTPARGVLNDYLRWTKHRWKFGPSWLAGVIGVTPATVRSWCRGASLPSCQNALVLERLIGMKPDWWMGDAARKIQAKAEREAFRLARLPPVAREPGSHNDWVLPGQMPLFSGVTKPIPERPSMLATPEAEQGIDDDDL